ncbi:MAG: NapC/NirT family cytochrome c [Burkholderiales bacterium]|nr:NapC/NirT family cytochrome c [Burkholderiales bacterium]
MANLTKWSFFWILVLGLIVGIALSAGTVSIVQTFGTTEFCSTFCHTMDGSTFAWKQGMHARTPSGVTAGCSDCHLLHESSKELTPAKYAELLVHKTKSGMVSLWGQIIGTYSTPEKWMERRAEPQKHVVDFMLGAGFSTCRGCHDLADMYNPKKPFVAKAHQGFINKPDTNCVQCHKTAGHDYKVIDAYIKEHGTYPPLADAWAAPAPAPKAAAPAAKPAAAPAAQPAAAPAPAAPAPAPAAQ